MRNVTGVILAGGHSSRMGSDKGLLLINGRSMIQMIIDAMKPLVDRIIIISGNEKYKEFGCDVYPDIIDDKGPVGGVYTALNHSHTDYALCVSCDTPFVTTELLNRLIEESEGNSATLYNFNGKLQPVISVYQTNVVSLIKGFLEDNQLKLMLVNESLNCKIINIGSKDFDEKVFFNVNTPEDLNKSRDESRC